MDYITTNQEVKPKSNWNTFSIVCILLTTAGFIGFLSFTLINNNTNTTFTSGSTYEGTWQAPNIKPISAKFTILSKKDTLLRIKYEWDINTQNPKQAEYDVHILPDGKHITMGGQNKSRRFTFTWIDQNHLQGKREENGITSIILMTKQ